MKLLFIHQSFPAQYRHLSAWYGADPANQVTGLGEGEHLRRDYLAPGVRQVGYRTPEPPRADAHFLAREFEAAAQRAMQAAGALKALKESGFEPDVILLHPDWGDGMLLRVYYPKTPVLAYAEYYNSAWAENMDFDPAHAPSEGLRCLAEARNAVRAVSLAGAAHLTAPFAFQRDLLPPALRERTSLVHDGIDTDWLCPAPEATFTVLPDAELLSPNNPPLPDYVPRRSEPLTLTREHEVFTFGTRTLEPCRGWPAFVRALPRIQKRRPQAHCIIVGRNRDYYGSAPEGEHAGRNWRDVYLDAVREELDFSRIHFIGTVPHEALHRIFAISRAHSYLTYPSYLSYSPLEAMSTGTPLVFSDTSPLRDVARHNENALLVDFYDPAELAEAVCRLLEDEELRERLGRAGREHVIRNYDLRRVCLPRWDKIIRALARGEEVTPLL